MVNLLVRLLLSLYHLNVFSLSRPFLFYRSPFLSVELEALFSSSFQITAVAQVDPVLPLTLADLCRPAHLFSSYLLNLCIILDSHGRHFLQGSMNWDFLIVNIASLFFGISSRSLMNSRCGDLVN